MNAKNVIYKLQFLKNLSIAKIWDAVHSFYSKMKCWTSVERFIYDLDPNSWSTRDKGQSPVCNIPWLPLLEWYKYENILIFWPVIGQLLTILCSHWLIHPTCLPVQPSGHAHNATWPRVYEQIFKNISCCMIFTIYHTIGHDTTCTWTVTWILNII